jgi:hypothetical protein
MERATVISHSVRNYFRLIVAAIGVFTLLVLVTVACYVHNVRFDLSPGARFTLSDHALGVLHGLDVPVRITAFIRTEDARNPILKDLLWQAAHENPLVSYTVVDINRSPALAAEYDVDAYGASVVEANGRRSDFSLPTESQLISAIVHVTQPPKKVYVVTGHGECDMNDQDSRHGCTGMRDAMSVELYDVEALSLFGGTPVPDDAAVVIEAGPTSDPLSEELRALAGYLDRGGKLLVMLEPFRTPRLCGMLGDYGIKCGDDIIIDPDNRLGGGEPFSAAVTDMNRNHLITATLRAPAVLSGTRSLHAIPDAEKNREATWLLRSGEYSWASHDPAVLQGRPPEFVAGRDVNGPLDVAVEVWMPAPGAAPDASKAPITRIVAFGDSDFVTNRFLDYLGNRDLFLNTVNWLAREEHLISTRKPAKRPGVNVFMVTEDDLRRIFQQAAVIEPVLFIAVGLLIFVWRRLRP